METRIEKEVKKQNKSSCVVAMAAGRRGGQIEQPPTTEAELAAAGKVDISSASLLYYSVVHALGNEHVAKQQGNDTEDQ